jgi:hypothetical protein
MNESPSDATTGRRRLAAALAMVATMLLGLASRHWPGALPQALGKYPGDALWALMVLWMWCVLRPRATAVQLALLALATSAAVEFAKLWQASWLTGFRHTTLGHLLLGHVFSWQNLVAYAVGVGAGLALEHALPRPAPPCPPTSIR